MTVEKDIVLWDNGREKLSLFPVPASQQYRYMENSPCVTFGIAYENENYKGRDIFTAFGSFYEDLLRAMQEAYRALTGSFRIADSAAETDGYVDFDLANGKLRVKGQLGASFCGYSLRFAMEADQTLVGALLRSLSVCGDSK